jgi:hypothetical protein
MDLHVGDKVTVVLEKPRHRLNGDQGVILEINTGVLPILVDLERNGPFVFEPHELKKQEPS